MKTSAAPYRFGIAWALVALLGCGDAGTVSSPPAEPLDYEATADDFECLKNWERVRNVRVANKLGFLDEALALARNPQQGLEYPVGTIIQLFPGEAMVKRGPDFDPANNNWEYFELLVSSAGTEINVRGREEVINMFGGQCLGCHEDAREFDFLCDKKRGCVGLPIDDAFITRLQETDPRCQEESAGARGR